MRYHFFGLLFCLTVFTSLHAGGQEQEDPAAEFLDGDFTSTFATVNGTRIHYVIGGNGPVLVLVHGFPKDWFVFHDIMPRLAQEFTVVAIDMRGIGQSAPISESYDASIVAEDIRQLAVKIGADPIYIVGEDNGGVVAYTFARLFPERTRGAMIIDMPLPGIAPWNAIKADSALWHFGFHQTPKLPETLITGREFDYFKSFNERFAFDRRAITVDDLAHYAKAYEGKNRLQAGLAFYRNAYPAAETFNSKTTSSPCPPIALVGGEYGMGPNYAATAADLKVHGCETVSVETVLDSGHWVVNEQPEAVIELIQKFAVP
jgi:pimeloyl-ACP methyl ester carboxylesterase